VQPNYGRIEIVEGLISSCKELAVDGMERSFIG
jgi:hypothetical protein